jgi:WD40 repeat protein
MAAWGEYGLKFFDMSDGCTLCRSVSGWFRCFVFSPDGKTYATGDANGNVTIWDTAKGNEIRSVLLEGEDLKLLSPQPRK